MASKMFHNFSNVLWPLKYVMCLYMCIYTYVYIINCHIYIKKMYTAILYYMYMYMYIHVHILHVHILHVQYYIV